MLKPARSLLALGLALLLTGCALLLPSRLAVAPTSRVVDLAVGSSTTFTVTNAGAAGSVLQWSFVAEELEAWPSSGSLVAGDSETVLVLAPSAAEGRTLQGRFVAPRQAADVSVAVVRGPALTCDPEVAFASGADTVRVLVGYRTAVARASSVRTSAASDAADLAGAVGGRQVREGTEGEHDLLEVPAAAAAALVRALEARPDVAYAEIDRPVARAAVGPDPRLVQQWNLTLFGAPASWAITDVAVAPTEPVVVAVVDDGVAIDHADLAAVLLPGYDVVHEDADPRNCTDHGTHVAGIVAAVRGNAEGVAGVASRPTEPWVRVLPVKAWPDSSDPTSTTQIDPIARAIRWAAGLPVAGTDALNPFPADVINLSLGALRTPSSTLAAAIDDAKALGVVFVAAAGNGSSADGVDYPARSGTIAVGSVDDDFGRSSFSNYGTGLTLMAPGGYGPDPACSAIVSTGVSYADGVATETYTCKAGTSMATPYVAGAVALLLGTDASLPVGADRHDAVEARLRSAAQERPGANPTEYGAGVLCLDALLTATHVCGEPVAP